LGAVAASRLLSPYLFGVTAYDPVAYGGIVGLLAAVSLVASWLPARRAGRVQPAMVARDDNYAVSFSRSTRICGSAAAILGA
jgi:hypothetical protein